MAKTPARALELMHAVWPARDRPRCRGGRRHAGDRRRRTAPGSRSSHGTTATTPRRCGGPSTTSTRTRSSSTCSSTSCARRCSTLRASCSGSRSLLWRRARCRCSTPTSGSGRSRSADRASTSGCGTSTPTPGRASARGPGPRAIAATRPFDGVRTVLASNNSNFVKGAPGEPVLISWDDARHASSTSSATRCTHCPRPSRIRR